MLKSGKLSHAAIAGQKALAELRQARQKLGRRADESMKNALRNAQAKLRRSQGKTTLGELAQDLLREAVNQHKNGKHFFGTVSEGSSNLEKLASYGRLGFHPNLQATLIGALVVVIMLVWPKKWGVKIPGSLVGIIVATAVSAALGLTELAVVGDIPRTLLLSDRLRLGSLNLAMLSNLISPIVTIAALGMIESLLCGASAARMKNEPFHADQELIAQGVGNILLPFFGGVPATAAIARTSVAIKSGQQTRLTSVFHSQI